MTTNEADPSQRGQQPDERNLVVRPEQTSLQRLPESNLLQQVGFSPQLPERLMQLNDVLAQGAKGVPVGNLEITLFPGEIPLVHTRIEPIYSYYVSLRSTTAAGASLTIATRGDEKDILQKGNGQGFYLGDIQDFVRSTFPETPVRLHAFRLWDRQDHPEDFDADLYQIDEEMLKQFTESLPPSKRTETRRFSYYGCEVRLQDHPKPLLSIWPNDRWHTDTRTREEREIILHVNKFFYEEKAVEVERVMEAAAKLFDKPSGYPYRWVDLHPEEVEEKEE